MVLTTLPDEKLLTTTVTLPPNAANKTITLDLDGYFQAWERTAIGAVNDRGVAIGVGLTNDEKFSWKPVVYDGIGRAVTRNEVLQNDTITSGGQIKNSWVSWNYMGERGLRTLTATAINTVGADGHGIPNASITQRVGINNVSRTQDDYVTNRDELAIKVRVLETTPVTANVNGGTVVKRTTIFGKTFDIDTCPDFPSQGSLADRIYNGQGNADHGDVVGTFNQQYHWANDGAVSLGQNLIFPDGIRNGTQLTQLDGGINRGGDGFFSGSDFNTEVLAGEGFGARVAVNADNSDAKDVPYRVLFFDNEGSDNGLYIMSGMADYNGGVLTNVDSGPFAGTLLPNGGATSNLGGKHTIVQVAGGKGKVMELSDINFA